MTTEEAAASLHQANSPQLSGSLTQVTSSLVPDVPSLQVGLHPISPGCDEDEGAFVGNLSSTAKDAIMEDEYEMSCQVRQSQTLWELPCTAAATDPALTL